MTYHHTCNCTLAINNMNSADSEGRDEKRRRINEGDHEATVRETAEDRKARLARWRQRQSFQGHIYANMHKIY